MFQRFSQNSSFRDTIIEKMVVTKFPDASPHGQSQNCSETLSQNCQSRDTHNAYIEEMRVTRFRDAWLYGKSQNSTCGQSSSSQSSPFSGRFHILPLKNEFILAFSSSSIYDEGFFIILNTCLFVNIEIFESNLTFTFNNKTLILFGALHIL